MKPKTLEELEKLLDEKIPHDAVSLRKGSHGKYLSYLEGHYVIDRLNKAFGPMNWSSETIRLECVHSGPSGDKVTVHYVAQVKLSVSGSGGHTSHTGTGYGDGQDKENIGKAHELAVKEAETDALKRAAKNLGQSMGLALYDKEQPNVEKPEEENLKKKSGDDNLLGLISSTSKVLVAKGKVTLVQLKEELKKEYGVESKDALTPVQAKAFLNSLNNRLKGDHNGQTNQQH